MSDIPGDDQEQSVVTMLRGLLDVSDDAQIYQQLTQWVQDNPDAVPQALLDQLQGSEVTALNAESLLESLLDITDLSAIKDPRVREEVERKRAERAGTKKATVADEAVSEKGEESAEPNIIQLHGPESPDSPDSGPAPTPRGPGGR